MTSIYFNKDAWKTKISDNITVHKSAEVVFTYPPTFKYRVIETGQTFTGKTGNVKEDYLKWKSRAATEISNEVTVFKQPYVYFKKPKTFNYTVIETGETFNGQTGDTKEDYMLWKADQRRRTFEISENVTVMSQIQFGNPPTFSYKVKETGEMFIGHTGNPSEDYKLWKAGQERKEEPMDTSE